MLCAPTAAGAFRAPRRRARSRPLARGARDAEAIVEAVQAQRAEFSGGLLRPRVRRCVAAALEDAGAPASGPDTQALLMADTQAREE